MNERFTAAYINNFHGDCELYGVFDTREDAQYWIDRYGLKKGPSGMNRGDPTLWEVLEIQRLTDE